MPSYTFTENTTSQNTSDTPTNGVCEDSRLLEANPTQNNGLTDPLAVAKFGVGDHQTTIMRFDTSSIPDSETITSVNRYIYQVFFGGPGTQRDFSFYAQIQTAWTEGGCTWNTYDGTNNWGSGGSQGLGTDIATTPFLQASIGNSTGQYYSFAISTSVVSKTGDTEFTIILDEVGDTGEISVFSSREGTDGQRPELEVITTAGGASVSPPRLHKLDNQFATIVASRLGGVLE